MMYESKPNVKPKSPSSIFFQRQTWYFKFAWYLGLALLLLCFPIHLALIKVFPEESFSDRIASISLAIFLFIEFIVARDLGGAGDKILESELKSIHARMKSLIRARNLTMFSIVTTIAAKASYDQSLSLGFQGKSDPNLIEKTNQFQNDMRKSAKPISDFLEEIAENRKSLEEIMNSPEKLAKSYEDPTSALMAVETIKRQLERFGEVNMKEIDAQIEGLLSENRIRQARGFNFRTLCLLAMSTVIWGWGSFLNKYVELGWNSFLTPI